MILWNYDNFSKYKEDSGWDPLKSTEGDLKALVEVFAQTDHSLKYMGYKASLDFEKLQKRAKARQLIDCDDIHYSLVCLTDTIKEEMEKYNKKRLNSFVFYYIGHGANIQGEDCLIDTAGHPTSVKSIMKLFEEKLLLRNTFLSWIAAAIP